MNNLTPDTAGAAIGAAIVLGIAFDAIRGRNKREQVDSAAPRMLVAKSEHTYDATETTRWLNRMSTLNRTEADRVTKGQTHFSWFVVRGWDGLTQFWLQSPGDRIHGVEQNLPYNLEWHEKPDEVPNTADAITHYIGLQHPLMPVRTADRDDGLLSMLRALSNGMCVEIRWSVGNEKAYLQKLEAAYRVHKPERVVGGAAREIGNTFGEALSEIGRAFTGRGPAQGGRSGGRPPSGPAPRPDPLPHQQREVQTLSGRFTEARDIAEVTIAVHTFKKEGESDEDHGKRATRQFYALLGGMRDLGGEMNRYVKSSRKSPIHLTHAELACLVHVPSAQDVKQPVIRQHARTVADDEFNSGVAIGYLRHPIQASRIIRIPTAQFERHFVLTGGTGSGKSTTLVFVVQDLIDKWATATPSKPQPGFTFVDPAGSTAQILLSRIMRVMDGPDDPRWEKVHFLSFDHADIPVALNVMRVLGSQDILALLQGEYGGGARIDTFVQNSVETLMKDTETHVIAGISSLLQDELWREPIVSRVRDVITKRFWERDFPVLAKNEGAFQPVQNRLRPFLGETTRLFFGQPGWAVPMQQWMDEGHIFLVDVKSIGSALTDLFLGMIVRYAHHACQKRPQDVSLTHFLLIDEAHRAQVDILPQIISEDRKFGLSLGLITQSVDQFRGEIKGAILDNVQNIITLRQGVGAGASVASELAHGTFQKAYLQALPDTVAAVYTRVGNKEESFEVMAPPPDTYTGYGESAVPVPFSDKVALGKRREELAAFGRILQSRIGTPADEAEKNLVRYLQTGRWDDKGEKRRAEQKTVADSFKVY